jgi:UDP-glucose:tetrahydrobiopterin glucosyltransferase
MSGVRIALVSTSVAPLGCGGGGGVELTIEVIASALQKLGHQLTLFAPVGSVVRSVPTVTTQGAFQFPAQRAQRQASIDMPNQPVLGSMLRAVAQRAADFDIVLNFAFDWLPLWLGTAMTVPFAHLISMGSTNDPVDCAIREALDHRPGCVAMHTKAQRSTYTAMGGRHITVLDNGIELDRYKVHSTHDERLVWVGRVAPEKGLADAAEVARRCNRPLVAYGFNEYPELLAEASALCDFTYGGFLSTDELAATLGGFHAMLMAPKWEEAFGNAVIEALACGLPVIAYERGGPAELIDDGLTGILVKPDDIDAMAAAVEAIDMISRVSCRATAEERFSAQSMGLRVERWLLDLLSAAA